MKETKRALNKYCRQIRRLLPCSRKVKRRILSQLLSNLQDYAAEHPDATYEQIKAQFGAPEDVAAACVESTGTAEILKAFQTHRKIVLITVLVAAAVWLSWTAYVTWLGYRVDSTLNGHVEVIVENPAPPRDIVYPTFGR